MLRQPIFQPSQQDILMSLLSYQQNMVMNSLLPFFQQPSQTQMQAQNPLVTNQILKQILQSQSSQTNYSNLNKMLSQMEKQNTSQSDQVIQGKIDNEDKTQTIRDFKETQLQDIQGSQIQTPNQKNEPTQQISFDSERQQLTIFQSKTQKQEVEDLITEVISHIEKSNDFLNKRKTEIQSKDQLNGKIYELLISKYQNQKKSREEMIKFIMRKVFKFLFKSLQSSSEKAISLQEAQTVCLGHYFDPQELTKLPFRKDSKIKTMNSKFLQKVFAQPKFVNDYKIFLNQFNEIIAKDNHKKINNIAQNICGHIERNQISKIKHMRRMPWSQKSLEDVQKLAIELLTMAGAPRGIQSRENSLQKELSVSEKNLEKRIKP